MVITSQVLTCKLKNLSLLSTIRFATCNEIKLHISYIENNRYTYFSACESLCSVTGESSLGSSVYYIERRPEDVVPFGQEQVSSCSGIESHLLCVRLHIKRHGHSVP
jgi:hypothetical protein